MSILDHLEENKKHVTDILTSVVEIEGNFRYNVYIDTVARDPVNDVETTIDMLHAVLYASHYIDSFRIDSVTISKDSKILADYIPKSIQVIESEYYPDTFEWSRFKVAASFNYRTRYKQADFMIDDEENIGGDYGMLRFYCQLCKICGRLLKVDDRYEPGTSGENTEYRITLKDEETYSTEFYKKSIENVCKDKDKINTTDLFNDLKNFSRQLDREQYFRVNTRDYEFSVYRYINRARAWSLKKKDWTTTVYLEPNPSYDKVKMSYDSIGRPARTEYGKSEFDFSYAIPVKGRCISDLYVRYRFLQTICEYSVFSKLFESDNAIYQRAELFWHMSPKKFRHRINEFFDHYNFSNHNYANFVLKEIMDAYDDKGVSAAIDLLSKEVNSALLPNKMKIKI